MKDVFRQIQKQNGIFEVRTIYNDTVIGHFIQEVDGYYHFKQSSSGLLSDYALIELGMKLKILNKDWDEYLNNIVI